MLEQTYFMRGRLSARGRLAYPNLAALPETTSQFGSDVPRSVYDADGSAQSRGDGVASRRQQTGHDGAQIADRLQDP